MIKSKIFIDLDGVIVDFEKKMKELNYTGDIMKKMPGIYQQLDAIPHAISNVNSLTGMGFEIWIATKPPTGIAQAYADKVSWILQNLPDLKRRIILTHNKGLLGCEKDYLIDDRPHKANCDQFAGTLLPFHEKGEMNFYTWDGILSYFRIIKLNQSF